MSIKDWLKSLFTKSAPIKPFPKECDACRYEISDFNWKGYLKNTEAANRTRDRVSGYDKHGPRGAMW